MKYVKTEAGQTAFKDRSPLMSSRQRSAFIMCDGVKDATRILKDAAAFGNTQVDLDDLVTKGLLVVEGGAAATTKPAQRVVDAGPESVPSSANEPDISALSLQERYARAYPMATQLTAKLGLRGFRLNLAVEGAGGFEDLVALLPKIQEAVGKDACRDLRHLLRT